MKVKKTGDLTHRTRDASMRSLQENTYEKD